MCISGRIGHCIRLHIYPRSMSLLELSHSFLYFLISRGVNDVVTFFEVSIYIFKTPPFPFLCYFQLFILSFELYTSLEFTYCLCLLSYCCVPCNPSSLQLPVNFPTPPSASLFHLHDTIVFITTGVINKHNVLACSIFTTTCLRLHPLKQTPKIITY